MTLRSRLALALVALSTVGLVVFGWTTAGLYARSQREQLDEQLRSIEPPLTGSLTRATLGGPFGATAGQPGTFVPNPAIDAYARLIDADGATVATSTPITTSARPKIPSDLADQARTAGEPVVVTTGSTKGSTEWRVIATAVVGPGGTPTRLGDGAVSIVAVPTTAVEDSVNRLVRIEVGAAVVLLTILGAGAWLILRHGLRPLEQMADSAEAITAGDLSHRVAPAEPTTEVGQLGLALNTMLDGIEDAFREREATEAKLRRFLADASHELRTPLTSIQGFAELFRLDPEGRQVDLPVILRRIEQESTRMRALVEDLLLLARLDEQRPVQPEPVDLAILAADACTDAVAIAPDRAVTLDAPSPVVINGIPDHLRQAIANLVANAVRHTPDGTPIEVSARVHGAHAEVTVRDHGPGLDADALAHVFDRFWQADAARVGTGAGLGLAIVAGIAEEHGGTASVTNAPDGGAAFTLALPLTGAAG